MSWCRLEALTVCDSFLKGTVGRGSHSWEGRTHLTPYSALIPALFRFSDARMSAVCVGTLTSPHNNFPICHCSRFSTHADIFQLHQRLSLNFYFSEDVYFFWLTLLLCIFQFPLHLFLSPCPRFSHRFLPSGPVVTVTAGDTASLQQCYVNHTVPLAGFSSAMQGYREHLPGG